MSVGSLSLFGGVATVKNVQLGVANGRAGNVARVTGLTVGKSAVAATPGRPIVIAPWSYVVALAQPDGAQAGALAVHLTKAHAGLPAGTVLPHRLRAARADEGEDAGREAARRGEGADREVARECTRGSQGDEDDESDRAKPKPKRSRSVTSRSASTASATSR